MSLFTIEEIIEATGGTLIKGRREVQIVGVSTDTRTIKEGELFIPLTGENFDGHQFLTVAMEKGAGALLIKEDYPLTEEQLNANSIIAVDDGLEALQALANYHLNKYKPIIVAVTGSTGKTTTKELIGAVVSQKYNILKTQGNFNNEIGLPLTLLRLQPKDEVAILEMGMSGLGEIRRLTEIAPPSIAVITNIGVAHIEKLGSIEGIVQAKGELLEALSKDGRAIINGDDQQRDQLIRKVKGTVVLVGEKEEGVDIRAVRVQPLGESGVEFTIRIDNHFYDLYIPLPGRHNVTNALLAIAVGLSLNLTMDDIMKGLQEVRPEKMRLNLVETPLGVRFINDAYNANPTSMLAALDVLVDVKGKRKFAVLGDMLELGKVAESSHRDIGRAVVEKGIDYLFTVGEQGRWIADEALRCGALPDTVFAFSNIKELTDTLKNHINQEDLVLLKGSRGMGMEKILSYLEQV